MDLIALAKNPAPSGATTGILNCPGGVKLRYARWEATRGPMRGTICLFQGRGEYIEKYFEVVADLRRRGFAVATMDWRGQGGSSRQLFNPYKGHVRSFREFDADLAAFMKEVALPHCQPPFIAMAHSMGGNILLRQASRPNSWFSRMVLTAPMIALDQAKLGVSVGVTRAYAEIMGVLGLGSLRVRKGSSLPLELGPFEGNPLTSDRERYERNRMVLQAAPQLGLGSPTIAWLRAAFRSMAMLRAPDYPLRVEVPLLLFAAGMDEVVSTQAIEEFALRLKVGTHVLIPQAKHEILQETAEIRQRFWAAFDAYLGANARVA
jgi:lysophospholipase